MKFAAKWFFRILWWSTFVVLALIFVALAYREWIGAQVAEKEIRKATGLEAEIGNLSFSILEPKMTFTDFKLYNPADFGGTPFLDMPELHVEYDRAALRHHQIHVALMRVSIRELDVVENSRGVTNIFALAQIAAPAGPGGVRKFGSFNGCQFTGIDTLNLSIGAVKFIDLKDRLHNRALALNLQNQILVNVKSPADFARLQSLIWTRGGYLVGLPGSPPRPAAPAGNSAGH